MKINKAGGLAVLLACINPLISLVFSFSNINRRNFKYFNVAISIAVFSIFLTIPPYQDLYRRYIENYLVYSKSTTYTEAITGHVDILMYVIILFMKKNCIPFYIFPALQAGFVNYLFLSSVKDLDEAGFYKGSEKLIYLISFLFINILAGALGIRFYIAVALITKGLTTYYFKRKNKKSYFFILVALLFHFSAVLPVIALYLSKFIKIKVKIVPLLFSIGLIFGSFILLEIINTGLLGYVGQYIKSGYIDYSTNAEVDTKGNAVAVTIWRYIMFLIIYIPCYFYSKRMYVENKFVNFISVYLLLCSLMSISFNAFNRYMIAYGSFFVLLNFYMVVELNIRKILVKILIIIMVFNFLFQNIYLQRRPIIFGKMWEGLYIPFIIEINKSDYEFKLQMNQIDSDGDWIKDKVATG